MTRDVDRRDARRPDAEQGTVQREGRGDRDARAAHGGRCIEPGDQCVAGSGGDVEIATGSTVRARRTASSTLHATRGLLTDEARRSGVSGVHVRHRQVEGHVQSIDPAPVAHASPSGRPARLYPHDPDG